MRLPYQIEYILQLTEGLRETIQYIPYIIAYPFVHFIPKVTEFLSLTMPMLYHKQYNEIWHTYFIYDFFVTIVVNGMITIVMAIIAVIVLPIFTKNTKELKNLQEEVEDLEKMILDNNKQHEKEYSEIILKTAQLNYIAAKYQSIPTDTGTKK